MAIDGETGYQHKDQRQNTNDLRGRETVKWKKEARHAGCSPAGQEECRTAIRRVRHQEPADNGKTRANPYQA
jgi:hypothetical protein